MRRLAYSCLYWLCFVLLPSYSTVLYAAADDMEYRFERAWPQLEQPWYFNNPQDIALAPDGSIWVADTYRAVN